MFKLKNKIIAFFRIFDVLDQTEILRKTLHKALINQAVECLV